MGDTNYWRSVEFEGDQRRREVLVQLTEKTVAASRPGLGRAARARVRVCYGGSASWRSGCDSVTVSSLDRSSVKDEQDQQQTKAAF